MAADRCRFHASDPCCNALGVAAFFFASLTMSGLVALVALAPPGYLGSTQFCGGVALWLCLWAVVWLAVCHGVECDCPPEGVAFLVLHPEPPPPPIYVLEADDD